MDWFEDAIEAELTRRLNEYIFAGTYRFDGMTMLEQRAINTFIAGMTEKRPVEFARELIAHYGDKLQTH